MRKFVLISVFAFLHCCCYAQEGIHVPINMLLQIHIPIQPGDKSWMQWNVIPSPQDSNKTIRIDSNVQGYAPFIPKVDAPHYSATQVKEIQAGLEKILNLDGYFNSQEELSAFCREFINAYVHANAGPVK